MKRVPIVLVAGTAVFAPLANAQTEDELTRGELVDRSGRICSNLQEATIPHVRRMNRAADAGNVNGVVRHGRRFVRTSRPYVRRLGELRPSAERDRYRRFVDNTRTALNWVDSALDALAARRGRLAQRRIETADRHAARAKGAARRYPLKRACIRYVS